MLFSSSAQSAPRPSSDLKSRNKGEPEQKRGKKSFVEVLAWFINTMLEVFEILGGREALKGLELQFQMSV